MSPAVRASLAYVAVYAGIGAAFPYLQVYFQSLGLELGTIGALLAANALVGLVAAPLWGVVADRLAGSRLVLPGAAAVATVGAVVLGVAPTLPLVAAGVAIVALGSAGVVPSLDARALDAVGEDRERYSRLRVWGSASFIVATTAIGWLIERIGVHAIFLVWVPALIATGIVTAFLPGRHHEIRLDRLEGLRRVLTERSIVRFLLAALLVFGANSAVNAFYSIHLLDAGAGAEVVGIAWGLGALVEVPLLWAFPALAARFGAERLVFLGSALFVVRSLVAALIAEPALLVALMAVHGAAFAFFVIGGVTYVSRRAPQGAAATAQGVYTSTWLGLAMIGGSSIGGAIAGAAGIASMYLVAAAVGTFGVLVLAAFTWHEIARGGGQRTVLVLPDAEPAPDR